MVPSAPESAIVPGRQAKPSHPPAPAGSAADPREDSPLAGNKRPSFLKRQKEQARLARASEKREAKRAKKHAKSLGQVEGDSDFDPTQPLDGPMVASDQSDRDEATTTGGGEAES